MIIKKIKNNKNKIPILVKIQKKYLYFKSAFWIKCWFCKYIWTDRYDNFMSDIWENIIDNLRISIQIVLSNIMKSLTFICSRNFQAINFGIITSEAVSYVPRPKSIYKINTYYKCTKILNLKL